MRGPGRQFTRMSSVLLWRSDWLHALWNCALWIVFVGSISNRNGQHFKQRGGSGKGRITTLENVIMTICDFFTAKRAAYKSDFAPVVKTYHHSWIWSSIYSPPWTVYQKFLVARVSEFTYTFRGCITRRFHYAFSNSFHSVNIFLDCQPVLVKPCSLPCVHRTVEQWGKMKQPCLVKNSFYQYSYYLLPNGPFKNAFEPEIFTPLVTPSLAFQNFASSFTLLQKIN
jgi:hypothetical protein